MMTMKCYMNMKILQKTNVFGYGICLFAIMQMLMITLIIITPGLLIILQKSKQDDGPFSYHKLNKCNSLNKRVLRKVLHK